MKSLFLQRVSSTVRTLTKHCLALVAAITLALTATSATARQDASGETELSTYKAQYRLSRGSLTLNVTRELKESGDGGFTLSQGGKNLVASIHEMSAFRVEGSRIVPKSFIYQLSAPFVKRRREIHFTPGASTIRSLYKDTWYDLPYTEGTLDRMSQQEQLRLFLLNDPTPKEDFTVPVADGKRIKEYEFAFVAEEMLQTALGELRTLHFRRVHDDPDRQSDTWIAPELGYLIVKATHIEDDSPTELLITSASGEGIESAK